MKKLGALIAACIIVTVPFTSEAASGDITLPSSCTVADTTGTEHTFPEQGSPSAYLGICALATAQSEGIVSSFTLVHYSGVGLFVETLDGVSLSDAFWSLSHNGASAQVGLAQLPLAEGDTIALTLTDFGSTPVPGYDPVEIRITALSGGADVSESGGNGIARTPFDARAAIAFLDSEQEPEGSFGIPLLTDWAAIALATDPYAQARSDIRRFLESDEAPLPSLTDCERRSMALMALGIDPYTGSPLDTIACITDSFDGTQFGDSGEVNDDIFAVIPLLFAGYGADDDMLRKAVLFILSDQRADGSWRGSADMTAAAIQALTPLCTIDGVSGALLRAEDYLHSSQDKTAGFGDSSFSTSWALQAIYALGEGPNAWAQETETPVSFLANRQAEDGGLEEDATRETRIWATAYAIPAALGRPWASILHAFPRPRTSGVAVEKAGAETPDSPQETPAEEILEETGEVTAPREEPPYSPSPAPREETPAPEEASAASTSQVAAASEFAPEIHARGFFSRVFRFFSNFF